MEATKTWVDITFTDGQVKPYKQFLEEHFDTRPIANFEVKSWEILDIFLNMTGNLDMVYIYHIKALKSGQ